VGVPQILDSHILGVLIFFQRMELQINNGRRRGRSFLDAVLAFAPRPAAPPMPSAGSLLA
jgi:hypothetical protein